MVCWKWIRAGPDQSWEEFFIVNTNKGSSFKYKTFDTPRLPPQRWELIRCAAENKVWMDN